MLSMQKFLARPDPFSWTLHNLVARPPGEVIRLVSPWLAGRLAEWLHNGTIPAHPEQKDR